MITTVVGSYPKISPDAKAPSLRVAIGRHDRGEMTDHELARVADEVTNEVIQEQIEAGLDLITDGQIQWDDGQTYMARGMEGFHVNGLTRYFDTNTYYRQPIAEEKVRWRSPATVAGYQYAASRSSKPVKAVITGPYTMAALSQLGCYSDMRDLAMDLAHALNKEALALQETGAQLIQFDEPGIVKNKGDIGLLQETSEAVTRGLAVKTAMYTWFGDISGIEDPLFRLPFNVFGLDFIMGRANYQLLGALPLDKELAAGIADARNTRMETMDQLVESIQTISRQVSLDRLYVNPSAGLEYLPRPTARAKLARLVEAARRAGEVLA